MFGMDGIEGSFIFAWFPCQCPFFAKSAAVVTFFTSAIPTKWPPISHEHNSLKNSVIEIHQPAEKRQSYMPNHEMHLLS